MTELEVALQQSTIRQALAPELLRERAAGLARLSDFGPGLAPALSQFQSFFSGISLTSHGLRRLSGHVLRALVSHLRLVAELRRTPELFAGRLNDPLIIVGQARTGTSYLQRLLGSLPGNRFLTFWEAREPIPDLEHDDRIERYEHLAEFIRQTEPELASKYPIDVKGPEECMFLTDPSLMSLSFPFMDAPCSDYAGWVVDDSHHEAYDTYRKLLLYLQAQAPERRFILKSPSHFGQLTELLRAVPEARLIHTHRDPVQTLGSICSTQKTVMGPAVAGWTDTLVGRDMLGWFELGTARNAAQREHLHAGVNIDVQFHDLTRDPLLVVERIYRHFGLEWTPQVGAALRAELSRSQPPEVGRHRYSLEEYGLTAGDVAERLIAYRRRWGFAA